MKYFCGVEGCFDVAIRGTGKRARCDEHSDDEEVRR
jgi:hypothetical protein